MGQGLMGLGFLRDSNWRAEGELAALIRSGGACLGFQIADDPAGISLVADALAVIREW